MNYNEKNELAYIIFPSVIEGVWGVYLRMLDPLYAESVEQQFILRQSLRFALQQIGIKRNIRLGFQLWPVWSKLEHWSEKITRDQICRPQYAWEGGPNRNFIELTFFIKPLQQSHTCSSIVTPTSCFKCQFTIKQGPHSASDMERTLHCDWSKGQCHYFWVAITSS